MRKMKNKKTILLAFAIFYSNQQMIPGATSRTCDISTYIQQIIGFGYATIGILTMFMLGIGAYQYIMSIGNTAQMTSAKNTVNYAILGLVLGLLSWIILYTINPNLVKVQLGETVPCTIQWTGTGTGAITGYSPYDPTKVVTSAEVDAIIKKVSAEQGVPEEIIRAIMGPESGGKNGAISPKGAKGLMQLMPSTAKSYGATDVFDPYQNVSAGTKYIKYLSTLFGGYNEAAFAAYNAGEGRTTKTMAKYGSDWLSNMPAETKNYVPQVMRNVPNELRSPVQLRTRL
jgi:hypothetical protein